MNKRFFSLQRVPYGTLFVLNFLGFCVRFITSSQQKYAERNLNFIIRILIFCAFG